MSLAGNVRKVLFLFGSIKMGLLVIVIKLDLSEPSLLDTIWG